MATKQSARPLSGGRTGVGCLSKDQLHDIDLLLEALTRVKEGGTFIDPEFVEQRFRLDAVQEVLTARELDVLRFLAEGCSNQGIANQLSLSSKTVESTLTTIFRKLEIDSKEGNPRVLAVVAFLSKPQSFVKLQS